MEEKGCIPYAVRIVNFVSAKANKRQLCSTAQQQIFTLRRVCCCSHGIILQSITMLTLQSVAKSCIAAPESCRCICIQAHRRNSATNSFTAAIVEVTTCVLPVLPTGAGPFHTPVRSCIIRHLHRDVVLTKTFRAKCACRGERTS